MEGGVDGLEHIRGEAQRLQVGLDSGVGAVPFALEVRMETPQARLDNRPLGAAGDGLDAA